MPAVRPVVVGGTFARKQLEGRDLDSVQTVGGPAVAAVGSGKPVGVGGPGSGPGEQLPDVETGGARLLKRGDRGG